MGSNNRPRTKDFFAAPALSLSLAGVFGWNAAAAAGGDDVEEGDEGNGGIRRGEAVISSENTGLARSHSGDGSAEEGHDDGGNKKRRKNYHRHTADQIRVMETVFKESPHPDEKQRQQLSRQLGLSARQVKFWFQNRRAQIKAIQERHENSLLKSELEMLRGENRAMREFIKKQPRCPNCCVAAASGDDAAAAPQEQQLRLENAKLKAEIEKLRGTLGKAAADDGVASPTSPPFSASTVQMNTTSPLDYYDGGFLGHDKPGILELAGRALDELTTMSSC